MPLVKDSKNTDIFRKLYVRVSGGSVPDTGSRGL